ncbi:MAG: hypothetical protein KAF91_01755 [Nostoc sp. TH1S01]|nr:hypothetical protein [Nostoc sp. TH1S01]
MRFNALELLAHNLLLGGKATLNQGFRGDGSNPSLIDQQSHSIRPILFKHPLSQRSHFAPNLVVNSLKLYVSHYCKMVILYST